MKPEPLIKAYSQIDIQEYRCLLSLMKEWEQTKPFAGKKVLLNAHLTLITLTMVHALWIAGAEVDVTAIHPLVVHGPERERFDTVTPLKEAGVCYYPDGAIPKDKRVNYYDVTFDCGAGLVGLVIPKQGSVEFTKTDYRVYEKIAYPVLDVGSSKSKKVETHFGTGDGLVRALIYYVENYVHSVKQRLQQIEAALKTDMQPAERTALIREIQMLKLSLSSIVPSSLFTEHKFVIFGYGKVGRGIAAALEGAGVSKSNIVVVDVAEAPIWHAKKDGFINTIYFNKQRDPSAINKIQFALANAFCAISATGIANVISDTFPKEFFDKVAIKVNMGTYDEFGRSFNEYEVLFNKKPVNFILPDPTAVVYLDPVFKILLKSGELLLTSRLTAGVHSIPEQLDKAVRLEWSTGADGDGQHAVWKHTTSIEKLRYFIQHAVAGDLSPPSSPPLYFFSLGSSDMSRIRALSDGSSTTTKTLQQTPVDLSTSI